MSFDITTVAVSLTIDDADGDNYDYYKAGYAYGDSYYGSRTIFTLDSSDNLTILSDGDPYPAKAGSESGYVNDGIAARAYGDEKFIEQYYNVTFPYLGGKGLTDIGINSIDSDSNSHKIESVGLFINGVKIDSQGFGYGAEGYPFSYTTDNSGGYQSQFYLETTDLITTDACDNSIQHLLNATKIDYILGVDDAGGDIKNFGYSLGDSTQGQYGIYDSYFLTTDAWKNDTFTNSNTYISGSNYSSDYLRNNDGHSKILGICFDGYPIYGPYGYTDSTSSINGVILMVSSYQTKAEEFVGRPYLYTDTFKYNTGSSTSTASAGIYIDDYEYVDGLGTLDEHNGRYCVTPEYPDGTYAYFITIEESNVPAFPYIIGLSTKNTLYRPNIDEVITADFPGAPTNISASSGDGYVIISFSDPSNDGGSRITKYVITDDSQTIDASGTSSPIIIDGLTNGTSYTFYVKGINLTGSGRNSSITVSPIGVPETPTSLSALAGNGYIEISFSAPENDGGSEILYYTVKDDSGTIDISGTTLSYTITGLTNGTTYTINVAAVNVIGTGASTTVSINPYTVPDAPSALFAVVGNKSVELYFSSPANGGSTILYYVSAVVDNSTYTIDSSSSDSPINVTGLTYGTSYYYSVAAVNAAGIGAYSSSVLVTPKSVSFAPTSVYTIAGNTYVDIYFTAPSDNGGAIIQSYSAVDIDTDVGVSGNSSPIRISGLINGTTYTYKVAALNAFGTGTYSEDVSAIPYTIPDAPEGVTATFVGNNSVEITFNTPATNGSDITQYLVTDSSGTIDVSGSSSPITVGELTNGTTYYFKVAAVNVAGTGPYSSFTNGVYPMDVPGIPSNVVATFGNAEIDVTYSSPSDNGSPILNYIISYNDVTIDISATTLSYTITGLTNGTSYAIKVAAINSNGQSSYSDEISITPSTVPDAPTIISADASNGSILVTFSASEDDGGSQITGYIASANRLGNITRVSGSVPTITISNLVNGTAYEVSVSAVNVAGTSDSSGSITNVIPRTVPGAPTITKTTSGDSNVVVYFSAPSTNGGSAIISYIITDIYDTIYASGSSSPLTVYNLTNGTEYTFYAKALNIAGTGASSVPISLTPRKPPTVPTNITTTIGDSYIDVSFSQPQDDGGSDITEYIITNKNNDILARGTKSPLNIANLINGTEYIFYITAYNKYGAGEVASFTVTPYTFPNAPTINSTIPENAAVRVYFTAPNNNGSLITEYNIIDSDGNVSASGTKSPIIAYNLTNGVAYTFYLVAINTAGQSPKSDAFNVTPYTTPSIPTITQLLPGDTYIDVSFSAPSSDGGFTITQYNIITRPGNKLAIGTTSPIRISNLINGTTYSFKIAAKNSAGLGSYSTNVDGVPYTIPNAPTITKIDSWNTSVDVYFTTPTNNGGLSINNYKVYYYKTISLYIVSGTTSPISISNLVNNTTYTFNVKAISNAGEGASSADLSATPIEVPFAPTINGAVTGSTAGSASIFVTAPSNIGGSDIESYLATSNPGGITASSTTSTIIVQNLNKGEPYTFTVQAINKYGTGFPSLASNSVIPFGTPNVPTITDVTPGNAYVDVYFSAPTNTGGLPIINYNVFANPDTGNSSGTMSPIRVSGLINGTSYTFTATAANAYGTSSISNTSSASIPYTVPDAPIDITIDNGDGQVDVYFNNPVNNGGSQIIGYIITDNSNVTITSGLSSPATIDGLTNGQLYNYLLVVTNAAGNSSPTTFTFTPFSVPSSPTITNIIYGIGYIDVYFDAPQDNGGSTILYYTINDGLKDTEGYDSPIRVTGLMNGSSYTLVISATNAAGKGVLSDPGVFTVPVSVPDVPSIVSLTPGNAYVDISFNAPDNNGGTSIVYYTATSNPSNIDVSGSLSPLRVTGLSNGISYTFKLTATNEVGTGAQAVSNATVPYTIPGAPTITNIIPEDASVKIFFDPPGSNGGADIFDYYVYYDTTQILVYKSPVTIYNLTNDTPYIFTMTARNLAGFSEASVAFPAVTPKNISTDYCKKQECTKILYSKQSTGGNDPKMSKAMRYSQVLRSNKPCNGFL